MQVKHGHPCCFLVLCQQGDLYPRAVAVKEGVGLSCLRLGKPIGSDGQPREHEQNPW